MRFGIHLRELWGHRWGLSVSLLLGLLAAVWSVASISLSPPGLKSRSLEMASAYTQVMVDTPQSVLFDLRQSSDDIHDLTNRALLVGSLMTTPPVLSYIGHSVGVPADRLEVEAPQTAAQPQPRSVTGRSNGPTDLIRTTDQYRLDVQADPIVPFLDIYAQAPTAAAAANLANSAVAGLRAYLHDGVLAQGTPSDARVAIRQLGRAHGKVINAGIQLQAALLAFFIVFVLSCGAVLALGRVRQGWRQAALPAAS